MSSKTKQIKCQSGFARTDVLKKYRATLLILLSIILLLILIQGVEAQGTPSQVIVFTDKTVYKDFYMQQGRGSGNIPAFVALETDDLAIYSYAIVLDDDGNIMKGLTGINGTLDDTKRLDHYHKNNATYHHNTTLNPDFYNNINFIYNDTGTFGDGLAGDGIYTAFINLTDADTTQANDLLDDHLVLNVSASFSSLTSYTEVLYSGMACHSGQSESHGTHTSSDVSTSSSGPSPCTICHRGMEHFFETKSTDQNGDPTFPYSKLDVHFQKIQPNYTVRGGNQALTVIWNLSKTGGTTWGGRGAHWETNMPGSSYCYVCHYATAGGSLLDYGTGGRTNLADRPSCSVAGKSLNAVTEAIACHSATKIEGESTLNWTDPAAAVGAGTSLNDTWKAKSHNQSNPPNKANVSCAICHGKIHQFKLPNFSVTGEDYLDIDNQCVICHNISGGLNITANGGKNNNHSNPNCKACHLNDNQKLDAHAMPAAEYPNANCTQCHDLGGRALLHIDFDIFNNSDYVHNMYNESTGQRPLNFNGSNGSAIRASENKICWGCHGDDPNNDGKANFSEQPANGHPGRYNNARRCEDCHQNASAPWGAPQNVAHSYNTNEVRTPGAPNCYDCHGQPVMFNNSHKDTDINESNEKGVKASFANHYGTGFPELAKSRGANGYCIDFCHQNTSSPWLLEFSNKENMQRPNHSAMTSRPLNQSCRTIQCHAADKIHDEKMRKPTLAGGTFGNANCTASGCHSPADSGMNYSYHNNVVNCTSCHMDNIGANIHPIKYLQNDGNDFAQVNTTAASCKLCHKNSMGDAVMNRWGVTPRKVGSQHHSADPENGSKWNKSIDPYWDYEPVLVTFATDWTTNSSRGFITNFDAVKDTNYSAARISENTTQDSFVGNYPSNHDFNISLQAGGWSSSGTATTKAWSNLPVDGNPNGSIIVGSTTRSQIVDANWTASFIYPKNGKVADARIKLDSKLVKVKGIDTTKLKVINITINDKFGNITEIFNRSLPDVPEVDWSVDEISIPDPDSVFWKNGTLDHTYNVTIRTRWTNINGLRSPDIKVAYDNIFVNVSEVDYKKYNFTFYINETRPSDRYNLVIGYQTHVEPARLYVKNNTGFNFKKDLDSGAFTKAIIPLSDEEYGNGNITLRINDSNGPGESVADVNEIDVKPDYIDIEYMFIESYKWKNESRVNYPCEYCHAPNKHSQHALGIPSWFMGNNSVGQNVNNSTTWCASCHYQGYSSGTKNYTDMTRTFIEHSLPVPPEITGHSLYGVNKTLSPDYYEHSELSSFDDATCQSCHKGNLNDSSTSTVFMHNVSAGKSGGRNCTACHGPESGVDVSIVNFTSVGKGIHALLNSKASSTPENASNKPCWACHGTVNGEWANETDQPSGQHDLTYKRSARKCQDCHRDTIPLFEAKSVTDHIPSGSSVNTDVNTSKYNMVYCALCHNNSVVESFDPDGMGRNPMGASASHYGANRTANKLMAQGINSTECVFCHRNTSNMAAWGILPESRANINNKNASGGGSNHNPYTTSSQCISCHGKYVISEGFTFHNSALGKGDAGGRNCIECHDIGAGMNNVNFSAFSESVHATINNAGQSSPQNAVNKPCWGCHGTINGAYANESDQPTNVHNSSVYKNPRKCEECHITGSLMFTSKNVTDHIPQGFSGLTDVKTASYCANCHNNSVKNGYEPDYMGIGGVDPMAASVSHYGSKEKLLETIGNTNISQGCIYCHYDNAADWGNATDPRTSIMRPHVETQNSQCWGCHIQGVILPSTFHNEILFAGGGNGTSPPVPAGSSKILVATNRYVILDDWNASANGGQAGTGFFVPTVTHTGTSGDSSLGINTKINATALFIDERGSPLSGRSITFNLYQPNGTEYDLARTNTTTNEYGLANFSFDMNKRAFYGNWTVKASNASFNDSTSFIYNWWGCGISGCRSGHPTDSFGTAGRINSPYLSGRERPSWSNHNTACTNCHQSFDGKPGGLTTGGTGHTNYASDVHRNITCDNANCHQSNTVHGASGQGAVIGSCYNTTSCHTPANRSDISGKYTLNNSNKTIAHSEYSENNGNDFNGTFHTPDSVVPCIICHGPMHNISKPDETQRFIRNSDTESSQCTTCHLNSSHSQNNAVACTLCHSSDAHAPKFITNLTSESDANYSQSRSSSAGCGDCHASSGINSYFTGKGYAPKINDSYGYNLTAHNNIVNCNTCHDRLHWIGYMNSTGQYQKSSSGSIVCLDCHSGTNSNVTNTNAYWGYLTPSKAMHNNSVPCESCHFESKHGIRFLQTGMVSFGSKVTSATCVNCHQQGYTGAPLIPAPLSHSTNSYSGALWNAAQPPFWDNTSQLSSCYYCHGSVLHSMSALGETNKVKGANSLNQSLTNSYWCANCHYKNAPDYAGDQFIIQPPEILNLNGLVPVTANDGTSFFNHSNDLSSGYDDAKCKTCHNNNLPAGSTSLNFTHNLGKGSSGGMNCIACHNVSSPGTSPKIDFTAINISVHGNLNIEASSSPEYIPNKPCWGCHGTKNGAFANESDQPSAAHDNTYKSNPRKCEDCHINGSLQFSAPEISEHIMPEKYPLTQINVTEGYCSSCHNNSITANNDDDGFGIISAMNASSSHYAKDANANLMTSETHSSNCTYCHFVNNESAQWLTPMKPLTSTHSSLSNDTPPSSCWGCHVDSQSEPTTFHAPGLNKGAAGGPDCISCHDNALGGGKQVNFSAMNDSQFIHRDLNKNAVTDGLSEENRKCWACHGNGSKPSSGHSSNYKTPYKCDQCHVPGPGQNQNFTPSNTILNVTQHYWNGTSINTAAVTSCYNCHNSSEMMLGTNLDPDGAGSIYGGANGGSSSISHYGRKRTDLVSIQGTNDYCYSCHNNASSVFPFIDNSNKTIANHSANYPSTNPDCADCHSTGRIHDLTLTKPDLNLSDSSFCDTCHGSSGLASIKNKDKHNATVQCSQCHLNSTRNIHPVQYLLPDRTSWATANTSVVNCTDCHQSGFANAPIIPDPLKHSNNVLNGSLWNNTPYWTSGTGSCYYCHENTKHNSTALGKISSLLTNQNNTRKGSLTTTTWCADCHYSDESNSNYKGDLFEPVPPKITENNTENTDWRNHSGYLTPGFADNICETCHGINTSSSMDSNNYTHSLNEGTVGGPDCISCHNNALGSGRQINFSAMNDSQFIHRDLNKNAVTDGLSEENRKCWACHGNGSKPSSGHSSNYKTPYKCDQCHVPGPGQNQNFTPANTILSVTQHYWNGTSINTAAVTSCYNCHNTSEMMLGTNLDPDGAGSIYGGANGGSSSISHYGRKRTDLTSIQGTNDYCYSCHNNASSVFPFIDNSNKTIANHSANYPSTNPDCADCHSTGRIHDLTLTKPDLNLSDSSFCDTCHGSSGSASIKNKDKHNATVQCSQCHLNSTRNIHPVQYLLPDRTSWASANTSVVNCTDCHQSGFANAPIIPDPLKHSNNVLNGSLWNNTPYWTSGTGSCYYCHEDTKHNSTALGKINSLLTNQNNTRKGSLTTTTWCADCHYSDASNSNYKGDLFEPVPPKITENNTEKPDWRNHSGYLNLGFVDNICETCHGINTSSPMDSNNYTHSLNEGTVGGPDCISCHNNALGSGRQINFSAMNDSQFIHRDLNKNAVTDGLSEENRKCWACHGNGSKPSSGHSSNYKTPYKCDQCHVPGPGQNQNFTPSNTILNVTQHYWNGTSINTAAVTSCYNCHNSSEMMLGTNLDPDGAGSIYGGANGGSSSISHYGRKRTDLTSIQGTNDYCYSCHNNTSTVFPFMDNSNKTIANHSANYPSTNPDCADCHSTGRIHDLTLTKPDLNLSDSSFCDTCHGSSGSASIKNKDKHNATVQCSQCHLNSTRNIHPVQYLLPDRTSWATANTSVVNCTDCHQSGFANAPIIPDPLKHSNNLLNGSLWNNTPYWTSGTGSCYYCHEDTKHNSTALGKINSLLINQNNTRKGSLTTTTWCADCHYSDASNSNYKGDLFEPVPPKITENNTEKPDWRNHTGYFGPVYNDSVCETCHAVNGSSSRDSLNYSHSLEAAIGGGPNCISCHDIGGSASKFINVTDTGNSMHKNLNDAMTNANKGCYACHGNGNAPANGHPVEYKNPKKCADCHLQGNYSSRVIQNHIPPKLANNPGRSISTNAYCTDCHNNSLNNFAYSVNGTVSHYGTNASLLKPTVNQTALPAFGFLDITEAQDHNKECNNCHKNYPFNLTYGNATRIEFGHTSRGACYQCHIEMRASDLHNSSLIIPETFSCLDCHTTDASKYKAPNMTGTVMATYPTTSCESNGCHGQGVTNGLLDTLNKHNIDRNYSGTPGNTGLVYLNGQNSITVNNGTQVLITSMINDISGGNYYASRVGLSEYYLDTDPGLGKGIALNAVDGQYDAVDGAWENVNATIDTTNLSVGMHTIYVRGMDIGKQWSATRNASLNIKSSIPYVPPAPVSLESTQGNFWINYTWQAGIGNISESFNVSVNGSWTNGTIPNYSNNSAGPHGWRNISFWAYNNSGNGSLSLAAASNNTQVANNNPVQSQVGNKTVAEGNLLTFTISATDLDSDILVNGTNATKGTFNPVTNQFNWTPGYGDQGTYFLNFNSSDNYGATAGQTITVTVNNIPLSITTSTPVTDPTSTESAIQSFTINLNRTSNVTWYMNGSIVRTNTSVISSNYANSTASIGVYNVTAIANDSFDTTMRKWNWTVTAIPTYQVSGYVFDNYGIGLVDVLVQNATNQDATSASGQYSITGLINGTYNFSFSKTGFNTEYQDLTINGADITNANKTIFDTTPPGQVTGLINDTPALTTVNLSWDPTSEANYYQVFKNTVSLGYTQNAYWNDTGLNSSTLYQYMVRANDTYDNWGQNSSILNVTTANLDTTPPASISDINLITGNFYINNTWINPEDIDLDYIWFRNSNGITVQNVSKPDNYLNLSYSVRYTQNISARTVDTSGNINMTQIWFNTSIPNNPPIQLPIGDKTITENQALQFTVISTDADSDPIIYGTNAANGTFNTGTGEFSWMPVFGETGIYMWYFNSSDNYGGFANETITVIVNEDPMGDCLSCHNSTQNNYSAIIQQSFGKHLNVDMADDPGILDKRDCLVCHYNVSYMFQPGFTTGTRICPDCHTQGNFSAPIIRNHRPDGVNITTSEYCSNCHNNSINIFTYNSNSSVSHYLTTNSLIKPTINHTIEPVFGFIIPDEASEYNRECSNCHNPSNASYGNGTQIALGHTSTATCNQCHLNADANNLHNGSFIKPVTSNCKACHTIYADIYKAPNLTNTTHKNYDCSIKCHIQPDYSPQGRLDPSDHNTDFTFSPGNKPTTDIVILNGSSSLTVFRGETVEVSSRIRDNPYTASRVRGAEYYLDSDPGSGKGSAMNAIDGYFDASNGAWENITGSIDTLTLTAGMHTVYVRGLDIGKQWSTSVAATLIVLDSNGFVNGTVRNSSGIGIVGATVITNTGESAITDINGFYSLYLMIGPYDLTAIKEPEFYSNNTFASVSITNSATEIREAVLSEKPTGTINGTVRNT